MRIPESELIINSDGSIFHLHIKPEELADTVILVGDPGRVDLVAKYLTDIEFRHESREFVSTTGRYNGKRITVLSTGIGTDNCDIVMTELDALANIDFATREVKKEHRTLTILRIGTSGAIQPEIPLGGFVFSHISVGIDGVMNWYGNRRKMAMPRISQEFKKQVHWNRHLCDPYFVKASDKLIKRFEDVTFKGMTLAAPGFYGPQGRVVRLPLAMENMIEDFQNFRFEGWKITNFEMEGSVIAGMGRLLGHECGTVCAIIAHRHHHGANTNYKSKVEELVKLALERLTM